MFFIKLFVKFFVFLYDKRLCPRTGYVHDFIYGYTWKQGYYAACDDLKDGQTCHLRSCERLAITGPRPFNFCPAKVVLLSQDPEFLSAWDEGYDRAIMLWRLHLDPNDNFTHLCHLAMPGFPEVEQIVYQVLNGGLRGSPEIPKWIDGSVLQRNYAMQLEMYDAYTLYAEKVQQIAGAYAKLCSDECMERAAKTAFKEKAH